MSKWYAIDVQFHIGVNGARYAKEIAVLCSNPRYIQHTRYHKMLRGTGNAAPTDARSKSTIDRADPWFRMGNRQCLYGRYD